MTAIDPEHLADDQRIVIEPGTVAHQQFLDGRALHRLREALPDSASLDLSLGRHPYSQLVAILYQRQPYDVTSQYWGGATVAEAADKCRAALLSDT